MLFDDNLSLKFGLYDLNSEFDVRLSSLVFLEPSQAIGPDFSLSGKNGPSIFPTTSLSFVAKYQDDNGFYFQSAVLDGVPGDPNNPAGTHIIFRKNYGLLLAGEAGYVRNGNDFGQVYEKFFSVPGTTPQSLKNFKVQVFQEPLLIRPAITVFIFPRKNFYGARH